MNYNTLSTLIQTHPSWPGVDDLTLYTWVNEAAISADREKLSSAEVYESIDSAEFTALSDIQKQDVRDILYIHHDGIPTVSGGSARDRIVAIFGGGSATIISLLALISSSITRAKDAGIDGEVKVGDIIYARTL